MPDLGAISAYAGAGFPHQTAALETFGMKFSAGGSHISRTMMLAELEAVLAAVPVGAAAPDYRAAILERNVLGKTTDSTRQKSLRHLRELYALDEASPIWGCLRKLYLRDPSALPLLALQVAWARDPMPAASVVCFELYPWHSRKWVPSAFNPSDAILNEAILEPIQSVGATWAIGKGKAWWQSLERLATKPGWRRLGGIGGAGERPCPSGVSHRQWLVVRAPHGLCVAAMKLESMPVWPKRHVVAEVRAELERIALS